MPRLFLPALAGILLLAASAASASEPLAASPTDIHPVLIGTEVPDVSVLDLEGNEVSLAELVHRRPTVLIFYRGGW